MWLDAVYGIDLDLYVKVSEPFLLRRDSIDGPRTGGTSYLKRFFLKV